MHCNQTKKLIRKKKFAVCFESLSIRFIYSIDKYKYYLNIDYFRHKLGFFGYSKHQM